MSVRPEQSSADDVKFTGLQGSPRKVVVVDSVKVELVDLHYIVRVSFMAGKRITTCKTERSRIGQHVVDDTDVVARACCRIFCDEHSPGRAR